MGSGDPVPPSPPVIPPWFVKRDQLAETVRDVCRSGRAVAITTSLTGAGGFGKSMLATAVCAEPRVRRHFRSRIYVITIGRDVRDDSEIAAKISEATRFITGDESQFSNPFNAGQHLGRLLDERPRILLVLDDVWEMRQLEHFRHGGSQCVRLVTTRNPHLVSGASARILVDEMSMEQARTVLTWDLPPLSHEVTEQLLKRTGRWALLLRLTNRLIARQVETGAPHESAAGWVLDRLRRHGPSALDPAGNWDMNKPDLRNQAAKASIEASITLLPSGSARLFTELSVFAKNESIPMQLIVLLWRTSSGLAEDDARSLCWKLQELSLIGLSGRDGGRVTLHDVIRDYAREQLSSTDRVDLHRRLVNEIAADLPLVPTPHGGASTDVPAWWETRGYVSDHLIEHLMAAGRDRQAFSVASDLRWIEARLTRLGVTAPVTDLVAIDTPAARTLAGSLSAITHQLRTVDPAQALVGILHNLLQDNVLWRQQVEHRRQDPALRPFLLRRWVKEGFHEYGDHAGHRITTCAISPDGAWVASGAYDRTVRIRRASDGALSPMLRSGVSPDSLGAGHVNAIRHIAFAPSGIWLATAGDGVRTWNLASRASTGLIGRAPSGNPVGDGGHVGDVRAVAVAADGSWMASGGDDTTVRIADPVTKEVTAVLRGHSGPVRSVSISARRGLLASGGEDGTVHLWDRTERTPRSVLRGHVGPVNSVSFEPDGRWLASGGDDGQIRLWTLAPDQQCDVLQGHTRPVRCVAISPDGRWLASAADDRSVRIWHVAERRTVAVERWNWELHTCTWSRDGDTLVVGGILGLLLFEFHS
ncbi:NB-ARC domain-containing protein [Streptomyces asoensis]|uniref:NB-ARC domain-containing protein n=1 Tax=Streptomyces asoensis TaxID=249586 RepID=UPI0033D3134C